MSGNKRKATEQLTRNSVVACQALQPLPPPVSSAPTTMGAIVSTARAVWGFIASWNLSPEYTDLNHEPSDGIHHQFLPPDHNASPHKRHKHRDDRNHRRERSHRPRSADNEFRRSGRGTLDISDCNSEGEGTKRVNDFWQPPDPLASRKPSIGIPRRAAKRSDIREHGGNTTISAEPRATSSWMTPEPSTSPPPSNYKRTHFAGKVETHQMPTTPESLPQDDATSPPTETDSLELSEHLSKLLNSEGGLAERRQLIPSGLSNQKRKLKQEELAALKLKEARREARELRLHRRSPRQALVQDLRYEWNDTVDGVIHSRDRERTWATSIGGTELRLKDFATLLGNRAWLNDEIINTYIEWIVDAANKAANAQAETFREKKSTTPKFIAHNSFFYENLIKKGPSSTQGLMRRKKAPGLSLMEVDSVFVPICKGSHWTVGVVRPIAKTIEYFDSMGGNPQPFIKLMKEWLKFQLGEKYVESDWRTPRTACAHQSNGYDCGVFVCTNALCVAVGLDTSCYDESDMLQQRRNIAAVLINGGFHGDFPWGEGGL